MRGSDERTGELFSYVDLEKRVPAKHPLRLVRSVVNEVLASLDSDFSNAYADSGRRSIPPERLLRALLLQAFYTIRSERQLMEQLDYNLLYRWFVGLGVDEAVWVPTVFTKNRDRLLAADVARKFLAELMDHKELRGLLSDEHFSVDGTQIAAWASMKSFRAKDGSDDPPGSGRNGERDFHGEKRSNATHASTTDPEAQLYRKGRGKEAKLSFMGHTLMENRSGLIVAATLTQATGTAERKAAEEMIVRHSPGARRITLGADKGYDAAAFVADMRALNVTPHIAQNISGRRSAVDARTTRHSGYAVSQRKRKRIEEPFGWGKTIGGLARPMLRAQNRDGWGVALCEEAASELPELFAAGRSVHGWSDHSALARELLGDDPARIVDSLKAAIRAGASPADLGRSLAYGAALRVARFGNVNEHADWETAHHVFTYANAVHQMLTRIGTANIHTHVTAVRGVLHGAMALYLARYLNVPPARIPGDGGDLLDDLPTDVEALRTALLDAFDRQRQVDLAARLVARHLTLGHPPRALIATLGQALLREDAGFHAYQMLEAGVRQFEEWGNTREGRHILIVVARYLAAHSPTERAGLQTADIARRLMRGGELHQEAPADGKPS